MKYTVITERAGDGSLYEVIDLRGRVRSRYPMALGAARSLAQTLEFDDRHEEDQERACAERE